MIQLQNSPCSIYSYLIKGLFGTGEGEGRGRDLGDFTPLPLFGWDNLVGGEGLFFKISPPLPSKPYPPKVRDLCGACSYFHCVDYFAPNIFKYLHFTQSITKNLVLNFLVDLLRSSFISIDQFLLHPHPHFFSPIFVQVSSPSIDFFFISINLRSDLL